MSKQDKLITYILSLGFIILILFFLIIIIQISRFVLEDTNTIGEHVVSTKNLLENIEEVQKSVKKSEESKILNNINIEQIKCNNYNDKINDIYYVNMQNNRSIISLVLTKPINKLNNTYYIEVEKFNNLEIGDNLLIKDENEYYDAQIFNFKEDDIIEVINFEKSRKLEITFENIIGKILARENQ